LACSKPRQRNCHTDHTTPRVTPPKASARTCLRPHTCPHQSTKFTPTITHQRLLKHQIFCPHNQHLTTITGSSAYITTSTTTDSATGPFTDFAIHVTTDYHQYQTFSFKIISNFTTLSCSFFNTIDKLKICVCFSLPPYAY